MGNVIKMDLYRLLRSIPFKVCLFLVAVIAFFCTPTAKSFTDLIRTFAESSAEIQESLEAGGEEMLFPAYENFSEILSNPLGVSISMIIVLISVVSFAFSDIANGYIKNIAGQLPKRGYTVISKFVVIFIHNFIFLCAGCIFYTIGELVTRKIVFDDQVGAAVATFFIKLVLMQAICTILLFITTGLRSKTFASIMGVLFGGGMLALVYAGANSLLNSLFKLDVDIAQYAPDQLLQAANIAVGNALITSGVIIVVFLALTVSIFNKSDIK